VRWAVSGAMSVYGSELMFATDKARGQWTGIGTNTDHERKDLNLHKSFDKNREFKFAVDFESKLTTQTMTQITRECEWIQSSQTCEVWLSVRVRVDDRWRSNRDRQNNAVVKTYPEGVPPQSHVVNARNRKGTEWDMKNGKYFVEVKQWWQAIEPMKLVIRLVDKDDVIQEPRSALSPDDMAEVVMSTGSGQSLLTLQIVAICLCVL